MFNWMKEYERKIDEVKPLATTEQLRQWQDMQKTYIETAGGTKAELAYWKFLRWLLLQGRIDV